MLLLNSTMIILTTLSTDSAQFIGLLCNDIFRVSFRYNINVIRFVWGLVIRDKLSGSIVNLYCVEDGYNPLPSNNYDSVSACTQSEM